MIGKWWIVVLLLGLASGCGALQDFAKWSQDPEAVQTTEDTVKAATESVLGGAVRVGEGIALVLALLEARKARRRTGEILGKVNGAK